MKKVLAVLLGALFVLSFAASAFAIHAEIPAETQAVVAKGETQITLGGYYRIRGWYRDNLDGNNFANAAPAEVGSSAHYDQRLRFLMTAKVNDNVTGHFTLQKDWAWGSFNNKADNNNAADVIEAWILYTGSGLFGVPAGLKVGHMPLTLGVHKNFFRHTTNGDDAIVAFINPTKQLHIAALTIKLDGDGGAGGLNAALGFGDTQQDNTDDTDGYVGLLTYSMSDAFNMGVNWTYLNLSDADMAFHNLGVHADGKVGGFGYAAEGNMQFGDFVGDSDAKGWSVSAEFSYAFDPVTISAGFGYGTGDDDPDDTEQFVTFLDRGVQHVFDAVVYEYSLNTTCGAVGAGLCNTTVYNLGLDFKPTKSLSARLDGYMFYASETPSNVDDNAGWEVDAGMVYSLAKNLKYYLDIGYMDTGDFYEDTYGDDEDVTVVRQQFILSF